MPAISWTKNPSVIEERSADRSGEASWKEESAEKGEENATGKSYRDAAILVGVHVRASFRSGSLRRLRSQRWTARRSISILARLRTQLRSRFGARSLGASPFEPFAGKSGIVREASFISDIDSCFLEFLCDPFGDPLAVYVYFRVRMETQEAN